VDVKGLRLGSYFLNSSLTCNSEICRLQVVIIEPASISWRGNEMIKRLLIIAIASTALLVGTTMYAQKPEKKETKEPKGPRIVLEEVEVTLYEDGKEIIRKRVTRKERLKLSTEASKKAKNRTLKKFGIKTYKELREKKLVGKINEEMKKIYRAKKIDPPQLKVIDEKGKVLKDIPIAEEKTKIKISDKRLKKDWDGERETWRIPVISDNKMFGAVVSTSTDRPLYTEEYTKEYREGIGEDFTQQSRITVYDNKGDVLYEKDYDKRTVLGGQRPEFTISNNGIVAVVTSKGVFGGGWFRLHVYDKNGKEKFIYPEQKKDIIDIRDITISPNGKYLAVRILNTVFFNVESGASWEADKSYIVYEISDNGIVRADWQNYPEKIIDLKENLGE
jgi:hypothetical protein